MVAAISRWLMPRAYIASTLSSMGETSLWYFLTICVKVLAMGGKRQTIPHEGYLRLAEAFHLKLNTAFLH